MQETASLTKTPTGLAVSGSINFFTAATLLKQSLPLLSATTTWFIDCSGISTVNSASLALFLEWAKKAEREKKDLTFTNLPSQFLSLADAAGVRHFLKIQ